MELLSTKSVSLLRVIWILDTIKRCASSSSEDDAAASSWLDGVGIIGCDFEDDLCGWSTDAGQWRTQNSDSQDGIPEPPCTPNFLMMNYKAYHDKGFAKLFSPFFAVSPHKNLLVSFFYYVHYKSLKKNEAPGQYHVLELSYKANNTRNVFWKAWRSTNETTGKDPKWRQTIQCIELKNDANASVQLFFDGRMGKGKDEVAIDDVRVKSADSCDDWSAFSSMNSNQDVCDDPFKDSAMEVDSYDDKSGGKRLSQWFQFFILFTTILFVIFS